MSLEPRCLSGQQCVGRTVDGPAAVTGRPLCELCITDVQKCLDELPGYRSVLVLFKGYTPSSVGQAKVKGSGEPKAPLNMTVVDLIGRIDWLLPQVCNMRARDLISTARGLRVAADVRDVWRKSEHMIGLQRHWERRHANCPKCDLPTLGNWVGEDLIRCSNSECAAVLSKSDYELHCGQ